RGPYSYNSGSKRISDSEVSDYDCDDGVGVVSGIVAFAVKHDESRRPDDQIKFWTFSYDQRCHSRIQIAAACQTQRDRYPGRCNVMDRCRSRCKVAQCEVRHWKLGVSWLKLWGYGWFKFLVGPGNVDYVTAVEQGEVAPPTGSDTFAYYEGPCASDVANEYSSPHLMKEPALSSAPSSLSPYFRHNGRDMQSSTLSVPEQVMSSNHCSRTGSLHVDSIGRTRSWSPSVPPPQSRGHSTPPPPPFTIITYFNTIQKRLSRSLAANVHVTNRNLYLARSIAVCTVR
ncbi:unnamed protein product, partial [Ranitomeya imitator]